MKITIELTGVELDALQRALAEENGEYNGKTAEEFVKGCVEEQFYSHDAIYREAVAAEEDFQRDMETARAIMEKRREVFRQLAKK